MSKLFYHVMQDNAGNLLFDVSGTMRLAGTGTAATIYGDEALTIPIANPMTNHPSFGSFKCFLGAGDYDFYMAKSGYTFETLTGVQGHGTMAQQNASAVAITGGVASLATLAINMPTPSYQLDVTGEARITRLGLGTPPASGYALRTSPTELALFSGHVGMGGVSPSYPLDVAGEARITRLGLGTPPASGYALRTSPTELALFSGHVGMGGVSPSYPLDVAGEARVTALGINTPPGTDALTVNGNLLLNGKVGIGAGTGANTQMMIAHAKTAATHGLTLQPNDADTGGGVEVAFQNLAGDFVGTISTNATATFYNTSSDVRLKRAIADLTGALDVVQRLRPVAHRWKADDSRGVGFLAHEVAEIVDGVITGEKDAVDEGGNILPQMIDYSKLVPFLVGAVKTLSEQVESLTARIAVLDDAR